MHAFLFLIKSDNQSQETPIIIDDKMQTGCYYGFTGPVFAYDVEKSKCNLSISIGQHCNAASISKPDIQMFLISKRCSTLSGLMDASDDGSKVSAPLSGGDAGKSYFGRYFFQVIDYEVFKIQQ